MAYEYDVFFSYKRDPGSDDWHEKVKAQLEFWLRQELQKQNVPIFFDTEEIKTGDHWMKRLSVALKQSRCIVCVWSPLYFQSKWCVSEWMTFVQREKLANRELVVAASFHDGEKFPLDAQKTQFLDFSPFANTMPAFWQTELAVRFLPLLKKFAQDLAEKIVKAPPFDEAFPVELVSSDKVEPSGPLKGLPMLESTSSKKQPGLVYTFYSYKGGVGRSMASANVGVLMATEGCRVLFVDWDLEAPGLEVFFRHDGKLLGDPSATPRRC